MNVHSSSAVSRRPHSPSPPLPRRLQIVAMVLRGLFMLTLIVIIVHVSTPQSERIWSAYETPGDLARMVLGLAVAFWLFVHIFRRPSDASGYRTWLYVGLVGLPFALICAFGVW